MKNNYNDDIYNRPIYAIICCEKLEERNTWPYFGAMKFMGYFHEKEDAFENVKHNAADINECSFEYAVIEEIRGGLYSVPRPRWFFKYNREEDKYEPIEEPKFMDHIANVL